LNLDPYKITIKLISSYLNVSSEVKIPFFSGRFSGIFCNKVNFQTQEVLKLLAELMLTYEKQDFPK